LSLQERAIYKRDNIEAKGKTAAGRKGAPPTQAALQKQVRFSLYKILTSQIFYGVWHYKAGGRWGGVHSAMVVQ